MKKYTIEKEKKKRNREEEQEKWKHYISILYRLLDNAQRMDYRYKIKYNNKLSS